MSSLLLKIGDFFLLGSFQAKEAKRMKGLVGPFKVRALVDSPFASLSVSQDASQPFSYPAIDIVEGLKADMFEVSVPSSQDGIEGGDGGFHTVPIASSGEWLEPFPHLL